MQPLPLHWGHRWFLEIHWASSSYCEEKEGIGSLYLVPSDVQEKEDVPALSPWYLFLKTYLFIRNGNIYLFSPMVDLNISILKCLSLIS